MTIYPWVFTMTGYIVRLTTLVGKSNSQQSNFGVQTRRQQVIRTVKHWIIIYVSAVENSR